MVRFITLNPNLARQHFSDPVRIFERGVKPTPEQEQRCLGANSKIFCQFYFVTNTLTTIAYKAVDLPKDEQPDTSTEYYEDYCSNPNGEDFQKICLARSKDRNTFWDTIVIYTAEGKAHTMPSRVIALTMKRRHGSHLK